MKYVNRQIRAEVVGLEFQYSDLVFAGVGNIDDAAWQFLSFLRPGIKISWLRTISLTARSPAKAWYELHEPFKLPAHPRYLNEFAQLCRDNPQITVNITVSDFPSGSGSNLDRAVSFLRRGAFLMLLLRDIDLTSLTPLSQSWRELCKEMVAETGGQLKVGKLRGTPNLRFWPSLTLTQFNDANFPGELNMFAPLEIMSNQTKSGDIQWEEQARDWIMNGI